MNSFINAIRSPLGIVAMIVVLLIASGVLVGLGRTLQANTTGFEAEHTATLADASVVAIKNKEIFTTDLLDLRGRVLNNIYKEHYEATGLVERDARYISSLERTDKDNYSFQLAFLPSKTTYSVDFKVNNLQEKNFTISVKQEDED